MLNILTKSGEIISQIFVLCSEFSVLSSGVFLLALGFQLYFVFACSLQREACSCILLPNALQKRDLFSVNDEQYQATYKCDQGVGK